jgi:UDP-glucose 4-epimerase
MRTNILITGGAGFIGSSLAQRLSQNPDNKIVLFDNLLTGKLSNISSLAKLPNVRFVKGDVNDYEDIAEVMVSHKFDSVFHYAAVVGVQRTLKYPIMVLEDIKGLENVFKLAKNTSVKRVFYSSSSEVYGEPVEIPQHEISTPLNARLPYAVVKNLGEVYLKAFSQEFGLPYTIFRFFNTYGPRQSKDFVVSKFLNAALKNEDITIYGDGMQSRTFCYIDDNIEATINSMLSDEFINSTVNIGNDEETTIKDLAQIVIDATGSNSHLKFLPPLKEGDMSRRKPVVDSMKKLLGREFTPLNKGLKTIINEWSKISL